MSLQRAAPLSLFFILTFVVVMSGAARVNVEMVNRFADSSTEVITAHCQSKDDDLGTTQGGPGAELASFSFGTNIWGTTLFFCTVVRGSGGDKVQFDVYNFKRDSYGRCFEHCNWSVTETGVHGFLEDSGEEDLFFAWGP